MPGKANQLPKGAKVKTPPPKRNSLPLRLAAPIVAGGALLVVIIGVVLLATAGRGSSGASPAQVTGQPKLTLDREKIDFGKVALDKTVKATFKLSNVGDQPLQILNQPVVEVKQGCWPPKVVVGSTTIQPGQSTELSMEFMMHKGMEGVHDFRVKVKTNDPVNPDKELVVLSDWGQWRNGVYNRPDSAQAGVDRADHGHTAQIQDHFQAQKKHL